MQKRSVLPIVLISIFCGLFFSPISFTVEKISPEQSFSLSQITTTLNIVQAQNAVNTGEGDNVSASVEVEGENTGFWNFFTNNDLPTIIATMLYWVLGWPFFLLSRLSAMLLDTFLFLSIDSTFYKGLEFIKGGWRITRDIANIGFIFALLVVAVGLVLNLKQINVKKLLVNIIVVAFAINFSIFFMYVAVDASNILTRIFYTNIEVSGESSFDDSVAIEGSSDTPKEITSAVMAKLNPQQLLSVDFYERDVDGRQLDGFTKMMYNIFIVVVLIGINALMTYIFTVVAILFLMRIITIALSVILAPLAMATLMFPGGDKIPYIGFNHWLGEFLKACFMAPLFVFFLFIILKFLESDFISISPSAGFWLTLVGIIVPFGLVIGLLFAAKDIAIKMSGKAGEAVGKAVGTAASAAVGVGAAVATGGAALAARGTLGAAGNAIGKSSRVNNWSNSDNTFKRASGNLLRGSGKYLATSSFDWRQTKVGQGIVAKTGMDAWGSGNAFSSQLKGGVQGAQERREKRLQDRLAGTKVQDYEKPQKELDIKKAELSQEKEKLTPLEEHKKQWQEEHGNEEEYKQHEQNVEQARKNVAEVNADPKSTEKQRNDAQQQLDNVLQAKKTYENDKKVNVVNPETGKLQLSSLSDIKQAIDEQKKAIRKQQVEVNIQQSAVDKISDTRKENLAVTVGREERARNAFNTVVKTIVVGAGVGTVGAITGGAALGTVTGAGAGLGAGVAVGVSSMLGYAASQRDQNNKKIEDLQNRIRLGVVGNKNSENGGNAKPLKQNPKPSK